MILLYGSKLRRLGGAVSGTCCRVLESGVWWRRKRKALWRLFHYHGQTWEMLYAIDSKTNHNDNLMYEFKMIIKEKLWPLSSWMIDDDEIVGKLALYVWSKDIFTSIFEILNDAYIVCTHCVMVNCIWGGIEKNCFFQKHQKKPKTSHLAALPYHQPTPNRHCHPIWLKTVLHITALKKRHSPKFANKKCSNAPEYRRQHLYTILIWEWI